MAAQNRKRWSQEVTETSFALELEPGAFTWDDPRRIALSLEESAEPSVRRKVGLSSCGAPEPADDGSIGISGMIGVCALKLGRFRP